MVNANREPSLRERKERALLADIEYNKIELLLLLTAGFDLLSPYDRKETMYYQRELFDKLNSLTASVSGKNFAAFAS